MSGGAQPLIQALGVASRDVVSVVGAGGKTSLVYALAEQALERGWRVLVTTTTHMGARAGPAPGAVLVESEGADERQLALALDRHGLVTLLGRRVRSDKLQGLAPERVDALAPRVDLVLVEADGARGRSLKLPAAHEPVLPASTSLLVALVGLDVLGEPLDAERVHRLDRVSAVCGREPGCSVDLELLRDALTSDRGYLAHRPRGGRAAVFLNKAETPEALGAARELAPALVPHWERVVAGSAALGQGRVLAGAGAGLLS